MAKIDGISPSRLPERAVFDRMLRRCYNRNAKDYKWYGARGICVCDRWRHDFLAFLSDMGRRPTAKHQIDRIDSNGPYAPDNCRWVTASENVRNRRCSRVLEFNGEKKTLVEWSEETGLLRSTITNRIDNAGWSISDALTQPIIRLRRRGLRK